MNATTGRRVLCAGLLALTILAAFLRRTTPTEALPTAHTVVLLLTPGLSYRDAETSGLFSTTTAHGVLTTRNASDGGPSADPLGTAARVTATGDRTPAVNAPTLGDVLRRAGVRVVLLTNGDVVASEVAGLPPPDPLLSDLPPWRGERVALPDGYVTEPNALARAIQTAVEAANAPGTPPTLLIATYDDLYRDDQYAPFALPSATRTQRTQSLERLVDTMRRLTAETDATRLSGKVALLLATSLASVEARSRNERLGPIALWTPDSAGQARLLTSPSTRSTPGLIAGTDVAATVASLLGVPANARTIGAGRAALMAADDNRLRGRIAAWDAQARAQTLLVEVPWALAALLIAAMLLARRSLPRPALAVAVATILYPAGLIGLSGFGVLEASATGFYAFAALPSLAAAGFALFAPRVLPNRRQILGGIGLLTALVVLIDTWTGGHLLAQSPLSYSVMEAARFYGIGNEAAGVLIGGALLAVAGLFEDDAIAIALFGAAVCLTLVLPMLGAKAGSLIGAAVGFGLAFGLRLGDRNRPRRLTPLFVLVAGIALASLLAFAVWDGARDLDSQTHLGQAIGGAHRGGIASLVTIARRKAAMDIHLATSSPWAVLLAVEAILSGYLYRRTRRQRVGNIGSEDWQICLIPLFAAGLCLLLFNDAGVEGAALCLLFAVPLAIVGAFRPASNISPIMRENSQP